MTAEERAADIMRRCWWKPEDGPHPGFKGLSMEIVIALYAAVAAERERCATLAEAKGREWEAEGEGESLMASQSYDGMANAARQIAVIIRNQEQ